MYIYEARQRGTGRDGTRGSDARLGTKVRGGVGSGDWCWLLGCVSVVTWVAGFAALVDVAVGNKRWGWVEVVE